MNPVIYFGPPKTSTTLLYHAFTAFPNYLRVGTKEWAYLILLDQLGEHEYTDRFGRFHGTQQFAEVWKPIYVSYIEHLKHFVQHPSSDYCQSQLHHAYRLIFERHSLDNYLSLFEVGANRFVVDFCPRNRAISAELLSQLVAKAPGAIFLVGVRPFLPLLVSMIHEVFVWLAGCNRHSDVIVIEQAQLSEEAFGRFGAFLRDALDHTFELYAHAAMPRVAKAEGQRHQTENMPTDPPSVSAIADRYLHLRDFAGDAFQFYENTNYVHLIEKLDVCSEQTIYFNAARIAGNLRRMGGELSKKGLDPGGFIDQATASRIRESRSEIVSRILAVEGVASRLKSVCGAAAKYFKTRVDARTFASLFPAGGTQTEDVSWEMLRRIDDSSSEFILQTPRLADRGITNLLDAPLRAVALLRRAGGRA